MSFAFDTFVSTNKDLKHERAPIDPTAFIGVTSDRARFVF